MRIEDRFSSDQLEAIQTAVAEAEERTSGEIVTYLVGRCDDYPEAPLRAAIVGVAVTLAGCLLLFVFDPMRASFLGDYGFFLVLSAPLLAGALCTAVCSLFEPLQRLLLNREDLARRVQQRAEAAFLEQEVFATRERTGVLIFVALFERRAVVLADSGIRQRLPEDAWQTVVAELCADLRSGEPAEGLRRAIASVGDLLHSGGVERRSDDRQELADTPRLHER